VHRVYPRVAVGDLCYVREAWGVFDATVSPRDGWDVGDPIPWPESYAICYRADGDDPDIPASWIEAPTGQKMLAVDDRWRPSIHMPRWAARDWLRVESIGPERVQWITEEGAIAEGATSREIVGRWSTAPGWSMDWSRVGEPSRWRAGETLTEADISLGTPRMAFANFINKTYDPGAWERNDWVWATKFTRTEAP
jgi:hypothetical protein